MNRSHSAGWFSVVSGALVFALATVGAAAIGACASTPAASPATPPHDGLPFIEDDYAQALGRARAEQKPLFIDTWAPWCHSCLALKTDVFPDPALVALADHFVWLSLDVDKPSAAPFLARFPSNGLPTLYVIDARNETAALRWLGTGTAPQLVTMLEEARKVIAGDAKADATTAARTLNAAVFALAREEQYAACAVAADTALRITTAGTLGRADVAISGLECAGQIDAKDARRGALEESLFAATRVIAEDRAMLTDDRSGAYSALVDAAKARGDQAGARALAATWSAFLDDTAAHAPTREARAALDAHRVMAYLELEEGARALPMLAQSEREFPADYNPAARTAYVLFKLARFDEALAASARAEKLVYGPRRLRVLSVKTDILEALHDLAGAIAALDEALAAAAALPEAQRSQKTLAALTARRAKLAAALPK